MVSLNGIELKYGVRELLRGISFLINPKDRIGLVGKNGSGKSTLLKIIVKEVHPDSGEVVIPGDVSVGYLPQHMDYKNDTTIFYEAEKAFKDINKILKDVEITNKKITEANDYESQEYIQLLDHLAFLNERLNLLDVNTKEEKTETCLLGLGFKREDFKRLTSELSGGWRMRIEIAKILLQRPTLLLLDEPTNHLDIESIQWLENFLKDYNGAIVLISHDRAFLDNITNRTIEISLGQIYDYDVPYSKYTVLKKERHEQQLATYRNQQKMIEDTEKFIEKFRYKATKAVQVQSRIKQLGKIDRIEVDEEDVASINIKFPPAPRTGKMVVEVKELSKSYGENVVLKNVDLVIERGEKIAFVGRNGEGKTTLSRIIMKEIDYEGIMSVGHNVNIGYFAQNQDEILDKNKTVFETIDAVAVGDIRTKIRDILGAFLFGGDDINKKVKVLSGGEKSRLALARLLLEPYNLLVLDEPTNHLDMHSKELLKSALSRYDGTLIIVSHDRYFLDGLINKVYEFGNKKVKEHLGGIYEFLQRKRMDSLRELELNKKVVSFAQNEKKDSLNKENFLIKKEFDKKLRKVKRQIEECEDEIHRLELQLNEMNDMLAAPKEFDNKETDIYTLYEDVKKKLDQEMHKWEILNNELEMLEQQKE